MLKKPRTGIIALLLSVAASALLCSSIAGATSKPPVKPNSKKTAAPAHMYRYTNDKGVLVTSSTIEPEFARKGYQVVTMQGDVLKTIPPEPTAEERQQIADQKERQASEAEQRERDKDLLLRYGSIDEIEIAKTRRLSEINNKIIILNSNIASLRSQIDIEQKNAAAYERNGQPIPPLLLKKIDDLKRDIKASDGQLNSRKTELADETNRFNTETERLKFLLQNKPPK